MRRRLALVVGMGVLVAGCGGAAGNGRVNGKVAFADGSPATGISLALTGQTVLVATTDATGHYAFTKVPQGDYLLSADVPSTLERHAQVVVVVGKSAASVPTLTFTAVGTISGTVADSQGNPAEGAEVRVLGTDRTASTDASGAFTLDRVRTGAQKLMASFGTGTDRVTGTASVTVKRGATATASVSLAAPPTPPPPPPPPAPGTVTGTVTYPLFADASTITIAAEGSTATTHPSPDGRFSLDLPPGTWKVDAAAPEYPSQTLGQARVRSGETVSLPAKMLSMYRPLPTFGLQGGSWTNGPFQSQQGYLPAGNRTLAMYQGPAGARYFVIDLDTLALHPIAVAGGSGMNLWLGPKGKQVAVLAGTQLYVLSIDTGTSVTATVDVGSPASVAFALDGTSALVYGPTGVDRMDLATGKLTKTAGDSLTRVGPAAFLIRTAYTAPNGTWALVTGAGTTAKAFDGVSELQAFAEGSGVGQRALVVARKACATPACGLLALAPGATTPVPVTLPDGSAFTDGGLGVGPIEGPYVVLQPSPLGPPGPYLLDTRTGKTVKMPFMVNGFQLSPDGSELAFISDTADAMYVGKASAPFAGTEVHGTELRGTFVAGDTFVAFDDATAARRLVFQGGAAPSVDTDYKQGSGQVRGALAYWIRPSTGNFAARFGDAAAVDLPIPAAGPIQAPGSAIPVTATGTAAPMAVVSGGPQQTAYFLDGVSGTVTSVPGLQVYFAFPGGFGAADLQSHTLDIPADGAAPVPLDEAGAPPYPNNGSFVAPGRTVLIDPPASPGAPFTIGVFPGLVPGAT